MYLKLHICIVGLVRKRELRTKWRFLCFKHNSLVCLYMIRTVPLSSLILRAYAVYEMSLRMVIPLEQSWPRPCSLTLHLNFLKRRKKNQCRGLQETWVMCSQITYEFHFSVGTCVPVSLCSTFKNIVRKWRGPVSKQDQNVNSQDNF